MTIARRFCDSCSLKSRCRPAQVCKKMMRRCPSKPIGSIVLRVGTVLSLQRIRGLQNDHSMLGVAHDGPPLDNSC